MDPITHTMTGALLAQAGWRRRTALATPAAILAANAADIDVLAYVHGEYAALALRRGWTHGPFALLALVLLTALLVLGWDRYVRRRHAPQAAPARAGPLLLLCLLAALTHPLLDWLNTYGVRWLMPLDRRWYYGDALFIIDPWIWLMLGVPLLLLHSRRLAARVGWAVGAVLASGIVIGAGVVPTTGIVIWLGALAAAVLLRMRWGSDPGERRRALLGRTGLAAVALYIGVMVGASHAAALRTAAYARGAGIAAQRIMIAPAPANPLRAEIVIATGTAYRFGTWDWRRGEPVRLHVELVPAGAMDRVAAAAAAAPEARDYLRWSRFPIIDVAEDDTGYTVSFGDARYRTRRGAGSLAGVTVRLDRELVPQ